MRRILPLLLLLPALAWAQSTPPTYGPGSVSTGGGGGSVSITSGSACLVVAPSPITGAGTVSETLPNRTVTTSPTISSADMCGAIFSNVSGGGTLTIPAISSTVFANGMTTTVVNYSASTEAVSTTPTINAGGGCVSGTGIPAGATWTLAGNGGAALDCIQTVSTGGTPPTGANPSATAGPTAVNGSAPTFMRSDGAPAIQKGTNAQFGVVEGDGVTFTCVAGVCSTISAAGTSGSAFTYSDNGVTLTANTYYAPIGGGGIPQTTEAAVSVKAPAAATVTNLNVQLSADPGAGQTLTVTLRVAGAGTTLTCVVTGGSGAICQDVTHSVSVAKNALIDWQIVTTGTYIGTPTITIAASNGVGATAGCSPSGTANQVLLDNGSAGCKEVSGLGASGTVLTSNGAGVAPTFQAAGSGSTTIIPPQGRLTCTTGTPVMTADVTACTTVYYDAFKGGNQVPVYSGSADVVLTIGAGEISDALPASSTGVLNASDVFDLWLINVSGTLTLCHATNGSGGGWASDTGGSITARGTGYSQLDTSTRAYITNKNAITHCYNGATDRGPISANQATYPGSLYTTAAGTTKMVMHPSATAGGNNSCLCLYNAFQQQLTEAASYDSTSNWSYGTNTWRASDAGATGSGLNNRVSWVDGLGQSRAYAEHYANVAGSGTAFGSGTIGVTFDSASATPVGVMATQYGGNNSSNPGSSMVGHDSKIAIGFHYAQAMEIAGSGNSAQWNGVINGGQSEAITLRLTN